MTGTLTATSTIRSGKPPSKGWRPGESRLARLFTPVLSVGVGIALWWLVSLFVSPILFASPAQTWDAFIVSLQNGSLVSNASASLFRILTGFVIGLLVGIPLGLLLGSSTWLRRFLDPYVNFLRFIPPIALLPVAILWFGIGEGSKIFLITYSSIFIVVLNAIAGVYAIPTVKRWAARSLGMGPADVFFRVTVPSTVPFLITGARIAMGNAFTTIVAAEMISAESGLGYMIFTARQFFQTGTMFTGILVIGLLGFLADRLLSFVGRRVLARYGTHDSAGAR
ncbi:ABC transporter permease [Microbacterium sp. CJ77]|uniref:ABC transporter permease n=1 Tax=unclassified Microbacterium TaxID=2609290 RepID=UPI000CD8B375|nr:ABC transporter permease [Microbacterium sp. CJ77]